MLLVAAITLLSMVRRRHRCHRFAIVVINVRIKLFLLRAKKRFIRIISIPIEDVNLITMEINGNK